MFELIPKEDMLERGGPREYSRFRKRVSDEGDDSNKGKQHIEYSLYKKSVIDYQLTLTERKKRALRRKIERIENSKFRRDRSPIKDWEWGIVGEISGDEFREKYGEDKIKRVGMIDVLKLMGYLCEPGRFVIRKRNNG